MTPPSPTAGKMGGTTATRGDFHIAAPRAPARLWLLCIAFGSLFLATLLPILQTKLPPLDDYINHLARMHVIALGGGDPLLDRFYGIDWKIVPNLAMDLLVPPLAWVTGVYAAGKIFVIAYTALLVTGPHAIHYALFRRLSLGPLVAVLFVYNRVYAMGWTNYLFGVGVALWGIAAWIALRQAAPARRAAVSLVFVVVLFFCHLSALGLYGVAIASIEAWRLWSHPLDRRARLADMAAFLGPFLAAVPLLLAGPSSDLPVPPVRWELFAKVYGLYFVIKAYSNVLDIAVALVMAACVLWAVRRRVLRLHPAGWVFVAASAVVYLAMPLEMMSAWAADVRLPIAMLFIFIGFLDWRLERPAARRVFLVALFGLAAFRLLVVEAAWSRFDRLYADFSHSLDEIAPGSKVLVARASPDEPAWLMPINYLPCLAMIERSSLVSLAFSHPLQQVLVVKPPYRAIAGGLNDDAIPIEELLVPPRHSHAAPSGRIYWVNWSRTYDYLYLLNTSHDANPAPDRLGLLYDGDHFQLYRVKHPT